MRIGIDARLYTQTGVGRYLRNLVAELQQIDAENDYVVYLRQEEYAEFKPINKRWQKKLVNLPWHTVKEQIIFPLILLQDNLDVAHFPYFNVPIFYPKKYLLTIHDLIIDHFDTGRASTLAVPLYKLKRLGYKISIASGIKKSWAITAISQTTKQEIIDHYHVTRDRIIVTYDALDINFLKSLKSQKAKKYYNFSYILYVGNAYPHKNLERLISALKIIREKKDIKLVLAGDDKYFYPRLKSYAAKKGLEKEVIFFGDADDRELVNLYTNSLCLVFPSLMEGFGLPNFEAIACGKLPVISDIPVFREVWEDDLSYFNPYDIDDMAKKILESVKLNNNDYNKKVRKAKLRIEKFSWRKTAHQTMKIYEEIHHENRIRI